MALRIPLSILLLAVSLSVRAADFRTDVWPILELRCIKCHGEDKQKGDLRLDHPGMFIQEMGFPVLEHSSDEMSILLERITLLEGDEDRMPPEGDGLTSIEIATLRSWIEAGAGFDGWKGFPAKAPRTPEWVHAELASLKVESEGVPEVIEFNRDVRPILSNSCYLCHGFDKNKRQAKLRLDVREDAIRDRDGRTVLKPGSITESALIARVFSHHVTDEMPPRDSGRSLSDMDRAILAKWIEQGAEYEKHWAYIVPERSPVPKVNGKKWVANPIDAFVLARLEDEGLQPAAPADKRTLLRRVTFDLTGLPTTFEGVESFKEDGRKRAFRKVVDKLLKSERYGERMAAYWLDLVRYADTNGYHSDEYRSVWPYRDYVIDAFNENMPFDQFTIEQVAGDMLPNATRDQLIASGYNRLNQISSEGGVQPGEYIVKYFSDRVRTTSTVWLGATMGCAECHDHKFDPFSQANFYEFGAFFADLKERGKYEHGKYGYGPFLLLTTPEQEDEITAFDKEIKELKSLINRAEDMSDAKKRYEGKLKAEENRKKRASEGIPSTLISESVKPREIRILPRGNWLDHSGPVVKPSIPSSLGVLNTEGRATRLDLAEWFVSEQNPLTARVYVNRLWKQFFGTGLSKVLDDFGAQGEWPSHPELLDWLAVEFMESGWDVQHVVQLIVTSNTYAQSSQVNAAALAIDPYNRLLAYQNRLRLEAEQVRDNALATTGLMVHQLGGPSVYPYQPESYYDDTYAGVGNKIIYHEDSGEKQYRRGLYVFWRRSFLQPSMLAFDAPTREECTAERVVSNIPQQALVLLNDPTYVEAARALAEDIVRDGGKSIDEKIAFAYRRVLARMPNPNEQEAVAKLATAHLAHYRANEDDAKKLLKIGQRVADDSLAAADVAAWTSVSRVLLNLHETITRM
ncbi:MAG: DUF1553 domain-containing protein [Candidatus Hydrogenedentota bacterium]